MSQLRLTTSAVAALFVVFFGSAPSANTEMGHVIILADLSGSMYDQMLPPIAFQTMGVTNGLRAYQTHCNHIRITYVPWGNDAGHIIVGDLDVKAPLITQIELTALDELGDTRHNAVWSTVQGLFQPGQSTAVVILTNGSGRRTVTGPIPEATIFKVAVLSDRARTYLEREFLPGTGTTVYTDSVESIAAVIEEALQSVDTACLS